MELQKYMDSLNFLTDDVYCAPDLMEVDEYQGNFF